MLSAADDTVALGSTRPSAEPRPPPQAASVMVARTARAAQRCRITGVLLKNVDTPPSGDPPKSRRGPPRPLRAFRELSQKTARPGHYRPNVRCGERSPEWEVPTWDGAA